MVVRIVEREDRVGLVEHELAQPRRARRVRLGQDRRLHLRVGEPPRPLGDRQARDAGIARSTFKRMMGLQPAQEGLPAASHLEHETRTRPVVLLDLREPRPPLLRPVR